MLYSTCSFPDCELGRNKDLGIEVAVRPSCSCC
jgi:hypothetical protein